MLEKTEYKLVICIGPNSEVYETLHEGSLKDIDALTTGFEKSDDIRMLYRNKIEAFNKKNETQIKEIQIQTGKTGDIVIINASENKKKKIKVLYRKHIKVFKKIILDKNFEKYLKENNYAEYCHIQQLKYKNIEFIEEYEPEIIEENDKLIITDNNNIKYQDQIGFFIRKVYKLYKIYEKEYNAKTVDMIYKEIKQRENEQFFEEPIDKSVISDMEDRAYTRKMYK